MSQMQNGQGSDGNSVNQHHSQEFQYITIDLLLAVGETGNFGALWTCEDVKSSHEINEIYKRLEVELRKRKFLDCYFRVTNYKLADIRMYILSRQNRLINDGLWKDEEQGYEAPKGFPTDKEIFQNLFVFFVIENDDYYKKPDMVSRIFMKQSLSWFTKKPKDFYIKCLTQHQNNYVAYSGDQELNCYFVIFLFLKKKGDMNIYCVIVYFLYHIKTKHREYIKDKEDSPLSYLLSNFILSKDEEGAAFRN